MNHPSLKNIQAYFEGADGKKIKDHIKNCDKCSLILSEMAKVDIVFNKIEETSVAQRVKNEVFVNAFELLKEKRECIQDENLKQLKRDQRSIKMSHIVRLPSFQASTILLLMILGTEASRNEKIIKSEKIIDNEFSVVYSEFEGERDEDF